MSVVRKHVARNVLGEAWKDKYYGLQVISSTVDGSSIAASANLLAMSWESGGGGTVAILGPDQINERKPALNYFRGHTGAVQDIQFCPFYSTIFATASEDTTVKLWDCGNTTQELEPRQDAVATLKGHSKRVSFTVFSEVAEWVIASGSVDGSVKVWDMEMQRDVHTRLFDSNPVSLRWNASCNLLALTSKNRELIVLDPRVDRLIGAPILAHEGAKPAKVDWCHDLRSLGENYLVTTGFSKSAERQLRLWDMRKLDKSIVHRDLDRASAILQPYVDPGTGLLVLYGKGNRSIYFYGFEPDDFVKFGEFEQLEPWKDVAVAPKRSVDVKKCEVLRCYGSLSTGIVQPISLIVPRRNMGAFPEDLYPDCLSGDPALRALDWFNGADAEPITASMRLVEGESAFEEKRPNNSGQLSFSRDLAPVRGTSSVLKKCLSVNKQTSQALILRLQALEEDLRKKETLIREQSAEIAELRNLSSTPQTMATRDFQTTPGSRGHDSGGHGRSINSLSASADTLSKTPVPFSDELDRKLADLAKRTSLNEENVNELRKLIFKSAQKSHIDPESPSEIIKMLLDRIATLQKRFDKVRLRNEILESLYSSLRKI